MKLKPILSSVVTFASLLIAIQGESAEISGKVQNGCANLEPVSRCDVKLVAFSKATFQRRVLDSLRTNSKGLFRFSRVEPDSGAVYLVSADFLGVSYVSNILQILRPDTTVDVTIVAYDTTSQPPEVSVQMHHVFAQRDTSDVLFREVLVVHNASSKTYIGQVKDAHFRKTLAFSIPPTAYAFQVESGLDLHRAVQEAHTLYDNAPLLPGIRQVSYLYRLSPEEGVLKYARKLDYPTRVFSFFVSDPSLGAESSVLSREEDFVIRGRRYQRLAGQDLSAGTLVEVTLKGSGIGGKIPVGWIVLFGLIIAAFFAFGFLVLSRRSKPAKVAGEDPLIAQREALLHEIAELDDAYEAGQIREAEYREKRTSLKGELVQITNRLRSGSHSSQR